MTELMNHLSLRSKYFSVAMALLMPLSSIAADKLTGTIIGTEYSYDYSRGQRSTTVNTRNDAFDGNLDTFFASYDRSNTWVGLDLGTPHVITKVAWSPRNDGNGPKRVCLGVFEGANSEDFIDAVPIYIIKENGTIGVMSEGEVNVTRGFRYVRYVGPNDARCNIAEVEFYGEPGEGSDDKLYQLTNLPTVVIHTQGAVDPYDKEHDQVSVVSIISNDGKDILFKDATTRLRGNASMNFPKKPYRIKFDKKQNVLDAPAKAKKWTLINNYGDKTLMRNILAFELSKRLGMKYTPYGTLVDVMVNGEYKGCYQLCDQIEVGKNRVDITEMEPTDIEGEALTGGYLVEVDAYAYNEVSWFNSNRGNPVTIKSPDEDAITYEQSEYIRNFFNEMESLLFSSKFTSETEGYRTRLDLESFLQHFIVGEFSGNTDTYWSTYMYKDRGDEQLHVGPVWDFDLAFNNDNRTYDINNLTDYVYRTKGSYAGQMRSFVNRIVVSDASAREQLKAMWADARIYRGYTEESLLALVDSLADVLDESQTLNFKRWNILNTKVHQNPKTYGSYQGEVDAVKSYISRRIEWLDKKLSFDPSMAIDVIDAAKNSAAEVYSLDGKCLLRSDDIRSAIGKLKSGCYIIKQQGRVVKVTI